MHVPHLDGIQPHHGIANHCVDNFNFAEWQFDCGLLHMFLHMTII